MKISDEDLAVVPVDVATARERYADESRLGNLREVVDKWGEKGQKEG